MKFNVIEICAGVGGFGLGFGEYGQVLSAVEWDKAAAGVYKYNNPEVEMFSDLNEVEATDLPWDADDLVICGGTPCQAFSVAGKRGSLSDDRGNLALTFNNLCNAIDDLRLNAGKEPAIILWENVCGAINTDDNAFGCILAGMAGSDSPLVPVGEQRWTNAGMVVGPRRNVAFRVLDSQFFGVAQRRRRIFAVAIGGSRKWAAPEALIPFQKSLPRNPKKGESSVEGSPGNAGASFTGTSFGKYEEGVGTLRSQGGDLGGGSETLAVYDARGNGDGKVPCTLTGDHQSRVTDYTALVAQGADVYNGEITGETAATVTSATGIANASGPKVLGFKPNQSAQAYGLGIEAEMSPTLEGAGGGNNKPAVVSWNGDVTPKAAEDVSVTLRSQQGGEGVGVAHGFYPTAGQDFPAFEEISPTVKCGSDGSSGNAPGVLQNLTVRRLSSVECMRLQGWPDDHCDFKMELEPDGNRWKATGKVVKQAEGPKYKQAGNGVTANVAAYIAGKLMDVLSK
jgi:DNA (cytosine-5)-methyltransferase 1